MRIHFITLAFSFFLSVTSTAQKTINLKNDASSRKKYNLKYSDVYLIMDKDSFFLNKQSEYTFIIPASIDSLKIFSVEKIKFLISNSDADLLINMDNKDLFYNTSFNLSIERGKSKKEYSYYAVIKYNNSIWSSTQPLVATKRK